VAKAHLRLCDGFVIEPRGQLYHFSQQIYTSGVKYFACDLSIFLFQTFMKKAVRYENIGLYYKV